MPGSKEYQHQWYLKNKEKILLRAKTFSKENPEKKKAYAKKWRENNKEMSRYLSKKWKKENPEKVKLQNKKDYINRNKERIRKYGLIYREKNKEKQEKQRRERYYRDIELSRKKSRERYQKNPYRKYERLGINIPKMISNQNKKCAICKQIKKLYVDHCHKKLIVRGLLCHQCNVALGLFYDSKENLNNAIAYLNATS